MIEETMATKYYRDKTTHISNKDLYLGYRYKWYDTTKSTIPIPYVSRKDVSDHKYKLAYKEWNKVVECYIEVVLEHLREGNLYTMPHGLGMLKLTKYKTKYIDYYKGKKAIEEGTLEKGTFYRRDDYNLDGYTFRLKWYRASKYHVVFRNKYLYELWLLRTSHKILYNYFKEDKSRIYRLSDT